MFFQPMRRRYFLRGLGQSALLLPYLPSVMARMAHAANERPRRYVQVMTSMGFYPDRFFPNVQVTPQGSTGIHAAPLTNIVGNMSQILGAAFNNGLKAKMTLVRGCHVMAGSTIHNSSLPTTASGTVQDNQGVGGPIFPYSVDTVMAASSTLYPDATGRQRHVVFAPEAGPWDNFSWNKINGSMQHVAATHDTSSLFAKFTTLGQTPGSAVDPRKERQKDVVHNVFADYRALRDSGKLSATDRQRLEGYVALVDEAQKGLNAAPPTVGTCSRPAQEDDGNALARHRNQIQIIAAAMACDLTRVVSYAIDVGYEPMHDAAHTNKIDLHANVQVGVLEKFAWLLTAMDSYQDAMGGTVLDNSVVYLGNEYGELYDGNAHIPRNMKVIVAGGGGGTLQMGYYIDYRKTGSRPLNNLLVSLFNAMGVGSAGYQRDGVVGFGEYNSAAIREFGFGAWTTNAERILPLPFLYKGAILG